MEYRLATELINTGPRTNKEIEVTGIKNALGKGRKPWNLYKNDNYICTGLVLSDAAKKVFNDKLVKREDDDYYNERYSLPPTRESNVDYYNRAVKRGIQYDGWGIFYSKTLETCKKAVSKYLNGDRPKLDKRGEWHIEYCHKDPKHNNNQTALDKERELLNITGGQK